MPATYGCPNPGQLAQFALGRIPGPEADVMEKHVAYCLSCGQALMSLPKSDPLVEAMRRASEEDSSCPDMVLLLIRQLKQKCTQNTIVHAPETVAPAGPSAFDFLDPARGPDEMGWLGPYRVREVLGAGGMGVVFLAEDPRLKRQIALKVIKPELVSREDMRQHFLSEAQSVAKVEHDNIVAIYEVSEQRGVLYLAMPILRGESLEDRLRRSRPPLTTEETIRIGRQIAEGLAAAHGKGLIHRDIKPANIFLESPHHAPSPTKGRGAARKSFSPLSAWWERGWG